MKRTEGEQKEWDAFIAKHPFQFHRLRLSEGKLRHENSLYKDYNCTENDLKECDSNFRRRIICRSAEEVKAAIKTPIAPRQRLLILTDIDYKTELKEYLA